MTNHTPQIKILWEGSADQSIAPPSYESTGAAGADLRANLPPADRATGIALAPMARALISTGLRVEIPVGYEMQIRPRSGLAFKHGITVLNAPGTIDSDYRGGVGVLLVNLSPTAYTINHGDRIAQAIIAPVLQASYEITDDLVPSARGTGGFGSTGRA